MTLPIRTLIVDDEDLGRKNLEYAIKEHSHWHIVGQAANVPQARILLATEKPDVVFLDIQMPRESGMVLAQELMSWPMPPLIIFVTAFNEHAIAAFRLHALDYLLKPLNDAHLIQAIERAQQMLQLRQQLNYAQALRKFVDNLDHSDGKKTYWQQLSVRSIGRIDLIKLEDVLWIEAQGNYMELHLAHKKILYRASMTQLEAHLDPACFIRVHRSFIIRIDQIESLAALPDHSYQVRLQCGDILPISERNLAEIKARLK